MQEKEGLIGSADRAELNFANFCILESRRVTVPCLARSHRACAPAHLPRGRCNTAGWHLLCHGCCHRKKVLSGEEGMNPGGFSCLAV